MRPILYMAWQHGIEYNISYFVKHRRNDKVGLTGIT